MFRARDSCAAAAVAFLAASCGEPARVGGRTLGEHLARIDDVAAPLRPALVRELGAFGDAGDAAVPRLSEWLHRDPVLRADAAAALGDIGTGAAQRALLGALTDATVPIEAVEPAASAAARCVPGDAFATEVRTLVERAPARAGRLLVTDAVFASALPDAALRRDVVLALAERVEELDARARDAALRRVAGLGAAAAGHEHLLASALARGVAPESAIEALASLGTERALEVVAERVREPWTARSATLLAAVARLGAASPETALAVIDRAESAEDPELRAARLAALGTLVRGTPAARSDVAHALERALGDPHPSVEEAARATWTGLVGDGTLGGAETAAAWARVAVATGDSARAQRIASALGSGRLPTPAAIAALRTIGDAAPPAVAAAAERALASIDDSDARAARIQILVRVDGPEATRRAALWAREPTTTFGELARALRAAARARPTPPFVAALLEEVDRRADGTDDARARLDLLSGLLADAGADRSARSGAARRLLSAAPDRAAIPVTIGDRTVRLRLLIDRSARATAPAAIPESEGALYVLPRSGRLSLDGTGLAGSRAAVFLDDAMQVRSRGTLTGSGDPIAADDVRAAVVLPVGVAADHDPTGLDPELVRELAR